jgi:hypothetical protein
MSKQVLLNNVEHGDLKVKVQHSAAFGDAVNQVLVFPTEFGDVQREYPIFLCKDSETGAYQSVALLGFDKHENLFLTDQGWQADYIPAFCARGPFLIGLKEHRVNGEPRREPMIYIDLDDPRVGTSEGTPVFLPMGGNSPYLERVASILRLMHEGIEASRAMFSEFDTLGLIEPLNVEIKLSETERYQLQDYYTISPERLTALRGAQLEQLNQSGYLLGAHLIIVSQANVSRLITLKQRKRATGEA